MMRDRPVEFPLTSRTDNTQVRHCHLYIFTWRPKAETLKELCRLPWNKWIVVSV